MYIYIYICILAAKVRVYRYENASHGGLNVLQRSRALRQAVDQAPYIGRYHIWKSWVDTNPLFVLKETYEECVAKGHTITRIEQAITGPGASRPHSLPTTATIRCRFHAALAGRLRRGEQCFPERRMRAQPRVAAQRALLTLETLRALVTPRISNAVVSTLWHRWTTARRFQQTQACCLQCAPEAQDSIEHYAVVL